MFKRVERKRKRREEEEELGLDEGAKETLGLNDTDSDESDSDSEHKSPQFDSDALDIGDDRDQEVDMASEDEGPDEESPITLAEALKDPIYLISLDPTIYGCVLCKGKLIKNAVMATTHRSASAHQRRFQHFKLLSANADPRSDAWELIRAICSTSDQSAESQELSKRALKRQAKQAAAREKRKLHKQLKAKAMAKKAIKKPSTAEDNPTVPSQNSQASPAPQNQPGNAREKQKLTSLTSITTILENESRDTRAKSPSRTKTSSKTALYKRLKSKRKPHKLP